MATLGHFVVAKYLPDPVRDEPINAAVVGMLGGMVRVGSHPLAMQRVFREDPQCDRRSVEALPELLESWTNSALVHLRGQTTLEGDTPERLVRLLRLESGPHLFFSDAGSFEASNISPAELEDAVTELTERLIKPLAGQPKWVPSPAPESIRRLRDTFADAIRQQRLLFNHYAIGATKHKRHMDFYHEAHGHAVGISVLKLDYTRDSQLLSAAHARAFELMDIRQGSGTECQLYVLCEFPARRSDAVEDAKDSLGFAAAKVLDAGREAAVVERVLSEALSK